MRLNLGYIFYGEDCLLNIVCVSRICGNESNSSKLKKIIHYSLTWHRGWHLSIAIRYHDIIHHFLPIILTSVLIWLTLDSLCLTLVKTKFSPYVQEFNSVETRRNNATYQTELGRVSNQWGSKKFLFLFEVSAKSELFPQFGVHIWNITQGHCNALPSPMWVSSFSLE